MMGIKICITIILVIYALGLCVDIPKQYEPNELDRASRDFWSVVAGMVFAGFIGFIVWVV